MKWVVRSPSGAHQVEVERGDGGFVVVIDGRPSAVDLVCLDAALASLRFTASGRSYAVTFQRDGARGFRIGVGEREFDLAVLSPVEAIEAVAGAERQGPSRVTAPIPGKVVAVNVAAGDLVEAGQPLVVLEAMKMQNELTGGRAGRVVAVHVTAGMTVEAGAVLVELE
jgi:biotin carboxyl carrier protein